MSDPLLEELRERFRETARVRLEEMTLLVAQIEANHSDFRALERLALHFHGLAGMGATYGFPRISVLGDEAEDLILPVVKRGSTPDEATVARWKSAVAEIAGELG